MDSLLEQFNEDVHARASLPVLRTVQDQNLSEISDSDLLNALTAMGVINSSTNKSGCGLRHELFDAKDFCPDRGLLFCPHSYSFALIAEAIRRLILRDMVSPDEGKVQMELLKSEVRKLTTMDMGGTFLQEEIASGGHSGIDSVPAFLEQMDLPADLVHTHTPNQARERACASIEKLQGGISEKIDAIRQWTLASLSAA